MQWKEQEEHAAHSWFVMHNASKKFNSKEHFYYYCNRTGNYNPRGKNKRAIKSQGTSYWGVSHHSHLAAGINYESH